MQDINHELFDILSSDSKNFAIDMDFWANANAVRGVHHPVGMLDISAAVKYGTLLCAVSHLAMEALCG